MSQIFVECHKSLFLLTQHAFIASVVSYMDEVESVYAWYTSGSVEKMWRLREPQIQLNVQVGTCVDKVGLVQYLNI
jgi:hypothetical protein